MRYVMMAIPEELVSAVAKFVEGRVESAPERVSQATLEPGFVHGWDRDTVRRAYRESADKMRGLLQFLAQNPGREVSSYEIAEAIDAKFGWNTVAGMLGALQRRSANHYGRSLPMWEFRYDSQDRVLVTMPKKVAEAIQSAE